MIGGVVHVLEIVPQKLVDQNRTPEGRLDLSQSIEPVLVVGQNWKLSCLDLALALPFYPVDTGYRAIVSADVCLEVAVLGFELVQEWLGPQQLGPQGTVGRKRTLRVVHPDAQNGGSEIKRGKPVAIGEENVIDLWLYNTVVQLVKLQLRNLLNYNVPYLSKSHKQHTLMCRRSSFSHTPRRTLWGCSCFLSRSGLRLRPPTVFPRWPSPTFWGWWSSLIAEWTFQNTGRTSLPHRGSALRIWPKTWNWGLWRK